MKNSLWLRAILVTTFLLSAVATNLLAVDMSGLIDGDCSKCHRKITIPISEHGGAHAESLDCQDCHLDHPQLRGDAVTILACSECHDPEENSHFSGENCIDCHNAHFPLGIDLANFTGSVAPICLGCHDGDYVTESAHAKNLQCNECHEQHATIPNCLDCHDGHSDGQIEEPCLGCHSAHDPLPTLPLANLPANECILCHQDTGETFAPADSGHLEQSCDECHGDHGQNLDCLECHEGHNEEMVASSCKACHDHHEPLPAFISPASSSSDCSACHTDIYDGFMAAASGHQENLSCVDCHKSHPSSEVEIVDCLDCHDSEDNPHFAVAGCVDCHDPHQPVPNDLSAMEGQGSVCAGCHQQVEEQISAYPGGHDQDCIDCHSVHNGVPSCFDCHEGHADGEGSMTAADCSSCHQPHAPELITPQVTLPPQLCSSCHENEVEIVAKSGAAHRDDLSCTECHQQHRDFSCTNCHSDHPQQDIVLPVSCFGCHSPADNVHFTVGDCLTCHDPHNPLEFDLPPEESHKNVCVGCHQPVAEEFVVQPSGHADQDCSACHSDHKVTRVCTDCHDAHDDSMVAADCQSCHLPHQPTQIKFAPAEKLPKQFCASCHDEQAEHLAAKGGKHQTEFSSCVACHPEHQPNGEQLSVGCNDCHPRYQRRHFQLDNCAGCHDPHQPVEISFAKGTELKPLCISCHGSQEPQLVEYPSAHSKFDCGKCHAETHGNTTGCLDCHSGHIADQSNNDCARCHMPHQPTNIKDRPRQVEDVCVSCHQEPAAGLEEQGGKHKKIACISCHRSHPPYGEKVIPVCGSCHDPDDNQHFAVTDCQACHLGHQPLGHDMAQAENSAPVCLTCHQEVGVFFDAVPSAHAEQNCSSCHPQHGEAKACTDCHEPHHSDQGEADCLTCHSAPHAPNQIAFNGELPVTFCQSCHDDQVNGLAAVETGHTELNCVVCHAGEHGSALECLSCHELPHDEKLHQKYPDCLKCHVDPHALADWSGVSEPAVSSVKVESPVDVKNGNAVEVETEKVAPEVKEEIPAGLSTADSEDGK